MTKCWHLLDLSIGYLWACYAILCSFPYCRIKNIFDKTWCHYFPLSPGTSQFNSHIFIKFNMPSRSSFCPDLIFSPLFSTRMWYSSACHRSRKSWAVPQRYHGCEKNGSGAAPVHTSHGEDGLWPGKLIPMAWNTV